jgi:hypothetical protein
MQPMVQNTLPVDAEDGHYTCRFTTAFGEVQCLVSAAALTRCAALHGATSPTDRMRAVKRYAHLVAMHHLAHRGGTRADRWLVEIRRDLVQCTRLSN